MSTCQDCFEAFVAEVTPALDAAGVPEVAALAELVAKFADVIAQALSTKNAAVAEIAAADLAAKAAEDAKFPKS